MIELGELIDMIWVDGDKPIYINTVAGECLEYYEDDISDELESTVTDINIFDSRVEIELGE